MASTKGKLTPPKASNPNLQNSGVRTPELSPSVRSVKPRRRHLWPWFLALIPILIVGLFSAAWFYFTTPRILVLGFHGIVDPNNLKAGTMVSPIAWRMDYPKQDLDQLLEHLLQQNYWFLSTQELYDFFITQSQKIPPEHVGQKPIMLTFDDGYKTVYTNLIPTLEALEKKYHKKAKVTLFVNPGTMDRPGHAFPYHLSCRQLKEGYRKGFYDIQSHGLNHKNLVELSEPELVTELAEAQTELRSCLAGIAPPSQVAAHIAYPFGASNRKVEVVAARYYLSGLLYNSKLLRFCWLDSPYRISRVTVNRHTLLNRVLNMVDQLRVIKSDRAC